MRSINSNMKHLLGVTTAGILGAVLIAGTAAAAVANAPPSILVFDQKPAGNSVSIDYANLPADGYIVVYGADASGQRTGNPLGYLPLKAGSHMDVKVELGAAPKAGMPLWASLYKDKDGKEGFNKAGDKPVWQNVPLQNAFNIQ